MICSPICITLAGIVTYDKLWQLEKAAWPTHIYNYNGGCNVYVLSLPIWLIVEPMIVTDTRLPHDLKALLSIYIYD
jgi:hypothetical protein